MNEAISIVKSLNSVKDKSEYIIVRNIKKIEILYSKIHIIEIEIVSYVNIIIRFFVHVMNSSSIVFNNRFLHYGDSHLNQLYGIW